MFSEKEQRLRVMISRTEKNEISWDKIYYPYPDEHHYLACINYDGADINIHFKIMSRFLKLVYILYGENSYDIVCEKRLKTLFNRLHALIKQQIYAREEARGLEKLEDETKQIPSIDYQPIFDSIRMRKQRFQSFLKDLSKPI